MTSGQATTIGMSLGLVLVTSACTDRVIHDRLCGDGRLSPGEVCIGEGDVSSLAIEGLAPLSIRVADFDGEGRPDLMVMGLDDATGAVAGRMFRGDGEGGFDAALDPGVYGCSAHPVPGAIDDDGIDDLLVDDCEASVSLFRGTSSGVFEPPLTVFTGALTSSSGLLDLDADGLREVVLYGSLDPQTLVLSVAEREPGGAFAAPVISPLGGLPSDFVPGGFGIFDFDGDQFPDALLSDGDRIEGIAVARGEAGLRFGVPTLIAPPGLPPGPTTSRDLDGDGTNEILQVRFDDQALVVLDIEGGTLVERASTDVPGLEPGLIALADIDGDDVLDFMRVDAGPAQLHAWLGRSDGTFTGPTRIDLDVPADQIAFADLDGDEALDLLVGSFEQSIVRVFLNAP